MSAIRALLCGIMIAATAACSARASVGAEISPSVVGGVVSDAPDRVWVCHRGRWQDVAPPAARGHDRHGDRVSATPRERGSDC